MGGLAIIGGSLLLGTWILAAFGVLTTVGAIMTYGQARLADDLRRRWRQAARERGHSSGADVPPFGQAAPWAAAAAAGGCATPEATEVEAAGDVPAWAVGAILPRLQERASGAKAKVGTLAQLTWNVWERVQLRPPAWWVSMLFVVGYVASLVGVAAAVVVLGTVMEGVN